MDPPCGRGPCWRNGTSRRNLRHGDGTRACGNAHDLKPFEYAKREKPDAGHEAEYFENTSADPDNYPLPEDLPAAEELMKNERLLADIRYPGEMDYSRPAAKGVDDSRGFIEDSREEENGAGHPAGTGKRSLFDRLFGKNKGKSGK